MDRMNTFIMVFTEDSRDKLLSQGFVHIKDNTNPIIYIFVNNPELTIELPKSEYVTTSLLSFDNGNV